MDVVVVFVTTGPKNESLLRMLSTMEEEGVVRGWLWTPMPALARTLETVASGQTVDLEPTEEKVQSKARDPRVPREIDPLLGLDFREAMLTPARPAASGRVWSPTQKYGWLLFAEHPGALEFKAELERHLNPRGRANRGRRQLQVQRVEGRGDRRHELPDYVPTSGGCTAVTEILSTYFEDREAFHAAFEWLDLGRVTDGDVDVEMWALACKKTS